MKAKESRSSSSRQPIFPKWKFISLELVLVVWTLFYIANGEALLGDYYFPGALIFYVLITIIGPIYFAPEGITKPNKDTIFRSILIAIPCFIITVIVCNLLFDKPQVAPPIGAIIYIVFIASCHEEVGFRKYMPKKFGVPLSILLFAVFHWLVLGASPAGFIFMIGFGTVQAGVYEIGGLGASCASHIGYNGHVMGVW